MYLISLVLNLDASFIVLGVRVKIPLIDAPPNDPEKKLVLYVWYGLPEDEGSTFLFYAGFLVENPKQAVDFTRTLTTSKLFICLFCPVANSFNG